MVVEASIVIEYLTLHYPGPVKLLPADPKAALEVRMMDRFFDLHIAAPQQKLVADVLRPEGQRDAFGVAEAWQKLDTAYAWHDKVMASRSWAAGEEFSMADCAAAPFLLYAHWSHPIPAHHEHVMAYLARLRPPLLRPLLGRGKTVSPHVPAGRTGRRRIVWANAKSSYAGQLDCPDHGLDRD